MIKTGRKVRLLETHHVGVVEKVRGTAVLVRWEFPRLDSRWNRFHSSWERKVDLTTDWR